MANVSPAEKLLQRPLYIFDLPEEIIYTLELITQVSNPAQSTPSDSASQSKPLPGSASSDGLDTAATSATSCNLCGLSFPTLLDQRGHVRSDLHRYNLKQKVQGKKPVSEAHFERLVGSLDESLSGSDSSESDDYEDSDDLNGAAKQRDSTLSALLKRQARLTDGDADDAPSAQRQRGSGKPPVLWFSSPKLPKNTTLGIYRAVFSQHEQEHEASLVETLQKKQLVPQSQPQRPPKPDAEDEGGVRLPPSMLPQQPASNGPNYFLCMIGGGHFAAMIVSLTPKLTRKAGFEDRSATVIAHKTFHRYTTRRKQGGSQSANDNSKGNAHSAGSSLRRYNETALTEEVRALLLEWKTWIDAAQLLFIRATGSTNRRTLFGPYEGQVLNHRDERIRGFPFSTRRATQSELMRSFVELTRVKVNVVDEAALAKAAEEAAAAKEAAAKASPAASKTSTAKAKPSKADEEASLHTTQLQALIRRSKAPAMLSYIQSNNIAADFHFHPSDQNHHAPTMLHLAAASNSPACISALLNKANADPTIRNPEGKTAFDLAGDRATRDAFRLARAHLGETRWAWDAAGVPAALSQSDVDARAAQEKAARVADEEAEKQRRQAETERLRREDAEKAAAGRDRKIGKGRVLDKPKLTAEERRAEEAKGMTDEMRLRMEREKRARAAEERMRRLQQG